MSVQVGFRQSLTRAPVVIATSGSDASNSSPFAAGWTKLMVTGSPANIRYVDQANLMHGSTTAKLTFTSIRFGADGEKISVTLVGGSGSHTLGVTTTGNDIVVQLATASGSITSTADQVKAAIDGSFDANTLITVISGGGGTVTAMTKTQLALDPATSADPLYPIGVEDLPIWRSGKIHALGSATAGQVCVVFYEPC